MPHTNTNKIHSFKRKATSEKKEAEHYTHMKEGCTENAVAFTVNLGTTTTHTDTVGSGLLDKKYNQNLFFL